MASMRFWIRACCLVLVAAEILPSPYRRQSVAQRGLLRCLLRQEGAQLLGIVSFSDSSSDWIWGMTP